MIIYKTKRNDEVGVYDANRFFARTETHNGVHFTRAQLTELRAIIDQALNTSAGELEASEAERERQRYAKVDPDRHIENAFVSTGEACSIRDASKALDA